MKKLLLLLFIVPLLSNSQSNDFLTNLFLDSVQIKNQDFKLELAGVVNKNAQEIRELDYYGNYDSDFTFSQTLFLSDIRMAIQKKSEVYLGSYDETNPYDFKDKCSWNWKGTNPNLEMISPYELNYFPTFSFLKGKLLTIMDGDSTNKDYLFSVTKSTKYDNYGHRNMHFNLTDDNENGYMINTVIIENQSYIIFSKSEMEKLGFQTEFKKGSQFKLICSYKSGDVSQYLNELSKDPEYYSYMFKNCKCVRDKNYLSIWKSKTKYMTGDLGLYSSNLYYLFKLVEQN